MKSKPSNTTLQKKTTSSQASSSSSVPTADSQRTCTLESKEVDSIIKGLTFATLNILDDAEGPKKSYQLEALKQITGSTEEANQTLPELLKNSFGMTLDCRLDVSGLSESGYPVGVQGYIAHNEKTIVLSYKLKKTVFQFLEEMDSTSTEWDVTKTEEVKTTSSLFVEQFMSLCSTHIGVFTKPNVHTGFYQNFLATLPMIKEHINPLLTSSQQRRSLFVVGHSIGAGVATLAACYFLLEFDWNKLPHRMVSVTGGSPRSCSPQMKSLIDERRKELGDSVRLFRVVQEDDIVPLMPSSTYGFQHVFPFVSIDEKGNITKQGDQPQQQPMPRTSTGKTDAGHLNGQPGVVPQLQAEKPKKDRVSRSPRSLRSHTHSSYMEPFLRAKGASTVAELRLKAMAPFSIQPMKPGSDGSKPKTSYPNTPRIKGAPTAVTSNSIGSKPTSPWWKTKTRKPTGNKRRLSSDKSKGGSASHHHKQELEHKNEKSSGSVMTDDAGTASASTSGGIRLHTRKPPADKRRNPTRGLVVL
ncbi:hypothetical protein ACA910_005605 [Epithemia clementina (nom. ined.)]